MTQPALFEIPHWRLRFVDPHRVHDPRCMLDKDHHRLTPCTWWAPGREIDRIGWWAWYKAGA